MGSPRAGSNPAHSDGVLREGVPKLQKDKQKQSPTLSRTAQGHPQGMLANADTSVKGLYISEKKKS